MILSLDTTAREEIKIGFDRDIKTVKTEKQSEEILSDIDDLLKEKNKTLQDISAIMVNNMAGSYTGVRIGVTIANTLAWSLDIPVLGYNLDNFESIFGQAKLSTGGFQSITLPKYETKD